MKTESWKVYTKFGSGVVGFKVVFSRRDHVEHFFCETGRMSDGVEALSMGPAVVG